MITSDVDTLSFHVTSTKSDPKTAALENQRTENSIKRFALPPWHLVGNGYVFIYWFPKSFVEKHGFLADFQKKNFSSGWGAVMLVDYQTSPVGPYQELLFIPGRFTFDNKKAFSISKIYVSTEASVVNGIENWAIPKEQAEFDWKKESGCERVSIKRNGVPFFEVELTKKGPGFSISTALFPLTIIQLSSRGLLLTEPTSSGKAYLARMKNLHVDGALFPDLLIVRPILCARVENFRMVFPHPMFV